MTLSFKEYSEKVKEFDRAPFPKSPYQKLYYTLGVCGESGEIAEKIKKLFRDKKGKITRFFVRKLEKEIGDVLWYLARLAEAFGTTLEKCAEKNITKLSSRKKRRKLHGDGDNR